MEWRDLAETVGKVAPILGSMLGGPVGTAIKVGSMIASALGVGGRPEDVSAALVTDPQSFVKLREIEKDRQVGLMSLQMEAVKAGIAADVEAARAVNTTMQAEAAASHWPTYSWRPFIGFCVGFNCAAASILTLGVFAAVICGAPQAPLAVAQLPIVLGALAAITGVVMPIVGIASYYRGKMQANPDIPTDNRG